MSTLHLQNLPAKVGKSDLLSLVDRVGGLGGRRVGRIDLVGDSATIEVPVGWETRLAQALDGVAVKGRKIRAWAQDPSLTASLGTEHFARMIGLVDLEREAEARRARERLARLSPADAQHTGESLVDLVVADVESALGGQYLLTLVKRQRTPLPWTRLDGGSPVVLSSDEKRAPSLRGVVHQRRETSILVDVASLPDEAQDVERWRIDLSSDEISSVRQRSALERARAARGDRLGQLCDVLLGLREPQFNPPAVEDALDAGLNQGQRQAAAFALSARDVALVHGPPGTGKTRTVVEVIRRAVRHGDRVLACGPSNMAVDNLLARLAAAGERVVRLGHPARVLPELRTHTLDALVERHEDVRLAKKLVKDALALFRRAGRTTRAKPEPGARRELRAEAKSLLADARRLETQAVEHILESAHVICGTTTGLADDLLGARVFDLVVIDEACQGTEPGTWAALVRARRVVLAGDHCQLPPTVLSDDARREGLTVSLFERLANSHGERILCRLERQYRMHETIMEFSSAEFYQSSLVADDTVRGHLLAGLSGVRDCSMTECPLEFIDTAGAGYDEQIEPDGESRFNDREARLVSVKVETLIAAGILPADIGVITPYAAQVRLLSERLNFAGLEIDTVDGFQGREKEAIIISLVRSNPLGEIGFLADTRRMNVAMTRARRKLIVIGDSATLATSEFYARWIEFCESHGAYRTVWEDDGGI